MRKILLDTNALTRFFAGDEKVLAALGAAETVYASVIVLGELYAGFRAGKKEKENKQIIARFLTKPTVAIIDATHETAQVFGEIKDSLRRAGSPIPSDDIWIASQAFETGAVLVTYDEHFLKVPGLRVWDEIG